MRHITALGALLVAVLQIILIVKSRQEKRGTGGQKMTDPISRQAAIAEFKHYALYDSNRTNAEWVRRIELVLESLPTIDAVPVVRCKDCKYRDTEDGLCEGRGWPMQLVPDDGFCDKGKRS